MIANNSNGLYTVIDSTLGILAHKVSREDAIQAILDAVEDAPMGEVSALLDATPEPAAYRTEWAAATAVELRQLETRVCASVTYQELNLLREQMIAEQQAALKGIEVEAKGKNLNELREQLKAEHRRLIQVLADEADASFEDTLEHFNRTVWRHLEGTKLYQRYAELAKEVA